MSELLAGGAMQKAKSADWLSLREASNYLGVHPTTLRRWADAGDVPVLLTPGGHRRFALNDLQLFATDRRRLKTMPGLEQMWSDQAMSQARQKLITHQHEHWLQAFDPPDRERKRALGRRLMGVLLRYISAQGDERELITEAREIGRAHGENTRSLGMPLVEAMHALLFFRDTVVEVALDLPAVAHVRPEANLVLLRRITTALNAVQLAVAEVYDEPRGTAA
jgi:excisionase family DNA binding protein